MVLFTFECDDYSKTERFIKSLRRSFPSANINSDGFITTLETAEEHAGKKVDQILDRHRKIILTNES